jgi:aspartate kinase
MDVLKFGGTSVANADALRRVMDIVSERHNHGSSVVAVLSATSGTTDALLSLARAAGERRMDDVERSINALRERHHAIIDDLIDGGAGRLSTRERISTILDSLTSYCKGMSYLSECTPQSLDEVASHGERLSTTIVAGALQDRGLDAVWFDVRSIVRTSADFTEATVQFADVANLVQTHLLPTLQLHDIVITQGFIGSTADGRTTTLGRGGSDYSAAIIGAACMARTIDIYTDVSGIYTTDPRLVPEARPVPAMSFREVRELALYGAKVLHPDTIEPAIEKSIPVRVLNTFQPNAPGTVITAEQPDDAAVHAITLLKQCIAIRTSSAQTALLARQIADASGFSVVIDMSWLEGSLFVVRYRDAEHAEHIKAAYHDVAEAIVDAGVIVAVGAGASHADTVAACAAVGVPHKPIGFASGLSRVSLACIVPDNHAVAMLQQLHKHICDVTSM